MAKIRKIKFFPLVLLCIALPVYASDVTAVNNSKSEIEIGDVR